MNKFKIITIVGARPQFIKAAAVSREIRNKYKESLEEKIIHSGQHYDANMSRVFFEEMEIPEPDFFLEVGSGSHGYQTGEIIRGTEAILQEEKPDLVMVYGDTNTTLAGALAASKMHIPVVHVEAGLRSFNKSMPEEINRIVSDHVSTLMFSPTMTGYRNLINEGFNTGAQPPFSVDNPAIFHCGDIMYDNSLYYLKAAEKKSRILKEAGLDGKDFILCTIHRDSNTDKAERLNPVMATLDQISREKQMHFILPLHPRTAKMLPLLLEKNLYSTIETNPFLHIKPPVTYFDMLLLESRCKMIITDSGGVQKESFFFHKPCLVLRPESEWVELIELGTASIVDADPERIRRTFDQYLQNPPGNFPDIFGDGKAAEFILEEIFKFLGQRLVN